MSIYTLPCRFNFEDQPLVGISFVHYFTSTYEGHRRVEREVRGDKHDFNIMHKAAACDGGRAHPVWLATQGMNVYERMAFDRE